MAIQEEEETNGSAVETFTSIKMVQIADNCAEDTENAREEIIQWWLSKFEEIKD